MKKNDLEFAIQQFIGFIHCYTGYNIESLAEAMSLTESEWEKIKEEISLPDNLDKDLDDYFIKKLESE